MTVLPFSGTPAETRAPDAAGLGDWRRPVRRGLAVAAVTLLGFGGWAAVAPLDSSVSASGTIVPESERKAIQHLEGGIVARIDVRDGARVEAGDVLAVIDATQARAGRDAQMKSLLTMLGDEARLSALVEGRDRPNFSPDLAQAGDDGARIVADQLRLFSETSKSIAQDVAMADSKIDAARAQASGVKAQWDAVRFQVASLEAEIERLGPAVQRGNVSRSRQTMLERERSDLDGRGSALAAELGRLARSVEEFEIEKKRVRQKSAEDSAARLAETRSKIADMREKLRVTQDVVERTEIRSPRAGRVVGLKLHTLGAVVRPGETLMEIVPEDDDLVVSARVSPLDVTHVAVGQTAEVRLPSFKSRSTPVAFGEVTMVAPDVVYDEANRQPRYDVRISVKTTGFPEEIRHRLRPGLPVEALVRTGERTLLAYLMQPLGDALRHGMREN